MIGWIVWLSLLLYRVNALCPKGFFEAAVLDSSCQEVLCQRECPCILGQACDKDGFICRVIEHEYGKQTSGCVEDADAADPSMPPTGQAPTPSPTRFRIELPVSLRSFPSYEDTYKQQQSGDEEEGVTTTATWNATMFGIIGCTIFVIVGLILLYRHMRRTLIMNMEGPGQYPAGQHEFVASGRRQDYTEEVAL